MSDWQLDRLPGDVRQEAENAAQRDGLPLHRWLGKLIRETCDDEGVAPGRELTRAGAGETAAKGGENGTASGPLRPAAAPPRPVAEPSRAAPPASPAESRQALAERPQAAVTPSNGIARGTVRREGQSAAAPSANLGETRHDPVRVAPVTARETAAPATRPITPPSPPAPPPAPARFSPLSTASPVSRAPAPMPPAPVSTPSPSPPSPVAAEPRPLPPRSEAAPPPIVKAAPPAVTSTAARLDDRMIALSNLVLSLRRNELSPIGEARLFLKLMTDHMASIADITIATGRTKEQVARSLRLLGLSDRLRDLIDRGALSREQAFALLDTDDPNAAAPVVPHPSGLRVP